MKNSLIFYGVPGVGKTHYTRKIYKDKEILELDMVRERAKKDFLKSQNPYVYLGTTEAYTEIGSRNKRNIVQGLKNVRDALQPYILKELERQKNEYIAESAFVDPKLVKEYGEPKLLVKENLLEHLKQFFRNRPKNIRMMKSFFTARVIQGFLIEEATKLNIKIIHI